MSIASELAEIRAEIAALKRPKRHNSGLPGVMAFRPDWPLREAVIAEARSRGLSVHAFLKQIAREAVNGRLNNLSENPTHLPVHHKPSHFHDQRTPRPEQARERKPDADNRAQLISAGAATFADKRSQNARAQTAGMLNETAGARFPGSIVPKAPNPSRKREPK